MRTSTKQHLVFNQTGRVQIPASCVKRRVEDQKITVLGFHTEGWLDSLSQEELANGRLLVDLQSLFVLDRYEVAAADALAATWSGLELQVPRELTSGDYRVSLTVTIALPADHVDGGRILARSPELVVVKGPDTGQGDGASLLPVRPSSGEIPELCRLEITEPHGPTLLINSTIPGTNWKELASNPWLKFSVFSGCIREVLRYLALNPASRDTWGRPWLELDGVAGRDLPDIEDQNGPEAFKDADDWANEAAEAMLETREVPRRFVEARDRRATR